MSRQPEVSRILAQNLELYKAFQNRAEIVRASAAIAPNPKAAREQRSAAIIGKALGRTVVGTITLSLDGRAHCYVRRGYGRNRDRGKDFGHFVSRDELHGYALSV